MYYNKMNNMENIIKKIEKAKNILVVSHISPDADTIASNIALNLFMSKLNKNVYSICFDDIPYIYNMFYNIKFFKKCEYKNIDLIISVDIATEKLLGFSNLEIDINIDHHKDNTKFGKYNYIDFSASSTTIIIWKILNMINKNLIDKDIATLLLLGLYSDTGSFMHANTNNEAYIIASQLIKLGANFNKISKIMFKNFSFNKLKIWGIIMQRINRNSNNSVISIIKNNDYEKLNIEKNDIEGVVEYLNMIPDSDYALLLNQKGDIIKASLRTMKNEIDVSKIASKFGGGGHKKASGFKIKGYLEESININLITPDSKVIKLV